DDAHDLGMARAAGADLFVVRVRRESARVADLSRDHTRGLPELPLGPPETAHAEDRRFGSGGKRRLERRFEDVVGLGNREQPAGSSRERLFLRGHRKACHHLISWAAWITDSGSPLSFHLRMSSVLKGAARRRWRT